MGRNAIETVLGAVVLVIAALFMAFAYTSADLRKVQGYTVTANFPMVDGLKEGGDVKVNGVKVGSIASMNLITDPGPDQFYVRVKMTIIPSVILPVDTIAMVASESLLGGKYLSLEIGVDDATVPTDGSGRLTRTQAPMRLDDLIGQVIYGSKKSDSAAPAAAAPSAAAPAAHAAPMPAAPVQAAPVQAAPVQAAPVQASPVQPAPAPATPEPAVP